MTLNPEIHPLTPDRWEDLAAVFGPSGACYGCWCMYWRLGSKEWSSARASTNRAAFEALVREGQVPGLLAYVDGRPAGWCAVAPREEYDRLRRSRTLKPVDERRAWSVVCFFVDRKQRGRGIAEALLQAAVAFAAERGAEVVEGYPVDPGDGRSPDTSVYTGTVSLFLKAGFEEVARPASTRRVIMRREV